MNVRVMLRDYLTLSKKSIVFLVVLSAGMGYFLGVSAGVQWMVLGWTLLGTGLMCAGSCALNHVLEADLDKQMTRTAKRPLPAGRISKAHATLFGLVLSLGAAYCLLNISIWMLVGGIVTSLLYLFLYTPLKRMTTWNTMIGGIPGALPALGGYLAAHGSLPLGAWSLFGILYCWQQPHFHSIAWMAKHDYARGGFKMLTVVDASGKQAFYHTVIFSGLMVMASIALYFATPLGLVYLVGAFILGIGFFKRVIVMKDPHDHLAAKRVLKASVYYLPLLFMAMGLDTLLQIWL